MNSRKQKLELTWIGKENRPKLEPCILLMYPALMYHAKRRVASADFRSATRLPIQRLAAPISSPCQSTTLDHFAGAGKMIVRGGIG